MKIISNINLTDFEFWSGAKHLAEKLTIEELETIGEQLEDLYPQGMTDTQINDLFWFEEDFICQIIGKRTQTVLERLTII